MTTPFTAADDGFHFDQLSDRWWETETCWFSFHHVERKLGGWLYVMVRPNIGTVAGGAWVWDDAAHLPWDVLYSTNFTSLRLPSEADLTDVTLPTGVAVKVVEPLTSYDIGYDDPGRLEVVLRFDATMPPFPLTQVGSSYGSAHHFDQFGRLTGTIVLHGESIEIDCISMRDRSWGPRLEHRPRKVAYVTGAVSGEHGFLALAEGGEVESPLSHGFLLRDGQIAALTGGLRVVTRDPDGGQVTTITIEGSDELGRSLHAVGEPLSRIIINRHTMIDSNSLIEWTIDGAQGWGEDQDLWPVHDFSAARRRAR